MRYPAQAATSKGQASLVAACCPCFWSMRLASINLSPLELIAAPSAARLLLTSLKEDSSFKEALRRCCQLGAGSIGGSGRGRHATTQPSYKESKAQHTRACGCAAPACTWHGGGARHDGRAWGPVRAGSTRVASTRLGRVLRFRSRVRN